jgi:hypothetical protein
MSISVVMVSVQMQHMLGSRPIRLTLCPVPCAGHCTTLIRCSSYPTGALKHVQGPWRITTGPPGISAAAAGSHWLPGAARPGGILNLSSFPTPVANRLRSLPPQQQGLLRAMATAVVREEFFNLPLRHDAKLAWLSPALRGCRTQPCCLEALQRRAGGGLTRLALGTAAHDLTVSHAPLQGHLLSGGRYSAAGGARQQEAAERRGLWQRHWQQRQWQRGAKRPSCRQRRRHGGWQGDDGDRCRLLPAAHSGGRGHAHTGEKDTGLGTLRALYL